MIWNKKTTANSVKEVVEELSGHSSDELLHPVGTSPEEIGGLVRAANLILETLKQNEPITVVGDYDADGVTSSAILYLLLTYLGTTPTIRIPKRMSEGYGLSPSIMSEIAQRQDRGLVLTVDNGIVAFEGIQIAKDAGLKVLVLDHHLPSKKLPNADIIVDQWSDELAMQDCSKIGFRSFCGAGLAYKLAQYLLKNDANAAELLEKLCCLATIGTIADVMPLIGENRIIVKQGLELINSGKAPIGVKAILDAMKLNDRTIDATTVGYYIAPAINAAGRLSDDGAKYACAILSCNGDKAPFKPAQNLRNINEQRKTLVRTELEKIKEQHIAFDSAPIIYMNPDIHEGICGIIAGKLVEEYGYPSIVMTKNRSGNWKGSARTAGDINLKERLDRTPESMLGYGGHAGAAGLSVENGKETEFINAMKKAFSDVKKVDTDILSYDIEIPAEKTEQTYHELQQYQPFGEGCPEPVVRINNCVFLQQRGGGYGFYMGAQKNHVKMTCKDGFSVVAFFQADKYKDMGEPICIDAVGQLARNESIYGKTLQISVDDFQKH